MKRKIFLILGIAVCLLLSAVCLADGEIPQPGGDNPITGDSATGMTTPAPTDVPTSTPTTAPTSGGNSGGNSSGSQSTASTSIPTDPREPKPDDNVSNATGEPNPEPTVEAVETDAPAPTDAPEAAEPAAAVQSGGMPAWGVVLIAIGAAGVAAGIVFLLMRKK